MNKKINDVVIKNENYVKDGVEWSLKKSKNGGRHAVLLNVTFNEENDISTSIVNMKLKVEKMYNDRLIGVSRIPLSGPRLDFEHLKAKDKMSGILFGNQETEKLFNKITSSLGIDPDKSVTHVFIKFIYDKEECVAAKLDYLLTYKESRKLD